MSRTLRALVPATAVLSAAVAAALVKQQLTDPVRPGVPLAVAPTAASLPPATSPAELAARTAERAERFRRPPPTEHWLHEGAERDNKKKRKAWIASIHRAPPELDWRAIERANGLTLLARRGELVAAPPPPTEPRWVERGSANLAGRMHVARHASDGGALYGGSSKGGLFRGSLAGTDWEPLGDSLYGGVHWLELLAPEVEGDPDIMVAASDGGLVHRSDDDGASWEEPSGLLGGQWSVRRLIASSDGSDALFMVSCTWNRCGLLRSLDTGRSFEELVSLGGFEGDVWLPRDGSAGLYLVDEGALWFSDDLGESFVQRGVIDAECGQVEIVGSEAGAPTLYAVVDEAALYRSDDAGESWQWMHGVEDYWKTLNASRLDPMLFAWGGVELHRSADGGASFDVVNAWWEYYDDPAVLLHADVPGLDVALDDEGNELWYISTDGGLYVSDDGLRSVVNLSLDGLRVSQYYDTLTSAAHPEHIAAGSQDQGYQITNTMTQPEGELRVFEQIISGDYGQLTSADGTHAVVFSVYPGFILAQVGEEDPWLDYGDFPSGESFVPWLPPIVADPDEREALFFPATRLYRYRLRDTAGFDMERWSDDSLELQGGEYVSALSFSPLDSAKAYLATNNGRMFHSTDHGVSWTRSASVGPDENWYYGQALLPSITDVDTAWVGGSGYGGPAVYMTTDGGTSWVDHSDGLPETMVYCLCQAPDGSGTLLAGTESAVYRRDPGGDWVEVGSPEAPITTYWSCESLVHENTIRFGTYGRGIWDYQLDPDHEGCYPVQDYDGDGVLCDEDCEDHDATVFPGAEDPCGDGLDQDCDGLDACEEPGVDPRGGRCQGCASGGAPPSGLGLLGLLGLGLRRRRGSRHIVPPGP
jgi:MYXO-CTERM domain-containing protein